MEIMYMITGVFIAIIKVSEVCFANNISDINVVVVSMGEEGFIESPGFPISANTPWNISLRLEGSQGHFLMQFSDLDLPLESSLNIHDGIDETKLLFKDQPHLKQSVWTRPVITSSGPAIYFNYTPGVTTDAKPSVGFKLHYMTVPSPPREWKFKKPYTECPVPNEVSDGGMIKLTTATTSGNGVKSEYYCVWQLKVSKAMSIAGFQVYAKVKIMNTVGNIEIRRGISSEGKLLADSGTNFLFVNGIWILNQPETGFTSSEGLYISVRKPTNNGKFVFTYGMYKPNALLSRGDESKCAYDFDGKSHEGFYCNSSSWCIPRKYMCNAVRNCPKGEDEQNCFKGKECVKMCEDGSCVSRNVVCPEKCITALNKKCDDGTCLYWFDACPGECKSSEKQCDDGSCVYQFSLCPNECENGKKMCIDGRCVHKMTKCPEEACTRHQFSCDNGIHCITDTEKCDGYSDCYDGSDEFNCYQEVSQDYTGMRTGLLIGVPVVIITFVASYLYKRSKREQVRAATAVAERHLQARINQNTQQRNTIVTLDTSYRQIAIMSNSSNRDNRDPIDYCTPTYGSDWSRQLDMPSTPTSGGGEEETELLETPPPAYESIANDCTTSGLPPPPSYEEAMNRR